MILESQGVRYMQSSEFLFFCWPILGMVASDSREYELNWVNSLIARTWAPVWLPKWSTQFEYLNIHVASFQLLNNLRHLHSIDLDFVYVCRISYTVIGLSQNFFAAVLWAEMSRSAAHFHALRDIPMNYCTGVNRHDTLTLSSQWQPKQSLYPDVRQEGSVSYCSMNGKEFGDCGGEDGRWLWRSMANR